MNNATLDRQIRREAAWALATILGAVAVLTTAGFLFDQLVPPTPRTIEVYVHLDAPLLVPR